MKKTESKQRVLMVNTADGKEHRVTLPEGCRVTFGPTIPYKKKEGTFNERIDGYSLRVYQGKSNDSLIAVFCDVRSFRDTIVTEEIALIKREGKTAWESCDDGSLKTETSVKVTKSFEEELKLLRS